MPPITSIRNLILASLLSLSLSPLLADSPSILIGIDIGDTLQSVEYPTPTNFASAGLRGSLGWKQSLPADIGLSLQLDASLKGDTPTIDFGLIAPHDQERLQVKGFIPIGPGQLNLTTGIAASFLGTADDQAFRLIPEWTAGYRWLDAPVNPFLRLDGAYRIEPITTGDSFSHSAELGLSIEPALTWGISALLRGRLLDYPETTALDSSGGSLTIKRQDMAVGGALKLTALPDYLSKIDLGVDGNYWWSNDQSYERILLGARLGTVITPNRNLSFELAFWDQANLYSSRTTLVPSGVNEPLWINSLGANIHGNWSPDGDWYLFVDLAGSWTLSNDAIFDIWDASLGIGVEISF